MSHQELEVSGPQEAVMMSTAERTLFLAGVGTGKSHIIGLETAEFIVNEPEIIQFVGANTYRQLAQSTLKRVFDTWLSVFGWQRGVDYVVDNIPPATFRRFGAPLKSYESTICFANGAMLLTASLDNYKVLDGTEFALAYLDETKDTKEEAVKEVIVARLRQQGLWIDEAGTLYNRKHYDARLADGRWRKVEVKGDLTLVDEQGGQIRAYNTLKIYTSPAKVDWLNLWFGLTNHYEQISKRIFSKTDFFHLADRNKCVVISSTYHNQSNLPIGYIAKLLDSYAGNQNLIDMLIFGSPIAKAGGEFVPTFDRLKHVKPDIAFDPEHTVHLTFDFNVVPHMTLVCAQLLDGDDGRQKLRVFREYCPAAPLNKTQAVCRMFLNDYQYDLYNGLFYYGDPAGRARQTVTTEFTDNYDVIRQSFAGHAGSYSDRVAHVAPGVIKSRDFLVALFQGVYGIDIEIDESCEHLVHDLEYCKEAPDGKMLKPKTTDTLTKQTYEKYGHALDAFRYLVCQLLNDYYQQFISSQEQ